MAVYVAFSDEAALADNDSQFLVAGYIADEKTWPFVARAWQERVLDGPPRIPYLHMTEIRSNSWRQRLSLSPEEAERRVDEAVRVLYSTGSLTAMASVIKRKDLREIVHTLYPTKKSVPQGLDEPDYACYLAYVNIMLVRVYAIYPDASRIKFIVSRKNAQIARGLKEVVRVIKEFLDAHRPDLASLFGDLEPVSAESQLPLQAADMLCWHLQRNFSGIFNRTEENRMWYLLKERDGAIHYWEREDLEEFVEALRAHGKIK